MPPVAPPTSHAASVLLAALPGIWASGWAIGRRATRAPLLSALLALGIGLAAWVECAHLIAYASHSFGIGMWSSSLLFGGLGWYVLLSKRLPLSVLRAFVARKSLRFMLVTALVAGATLAPIALSTAFHDEIGPNGHLANMSTIQNGSYPPRDLTFPAVELKYHYGYDLLSAMLSAITRLDVSVASDILTIGAWAYLWLLAWALGVRVAGRFGGPVLALTLLYGSGAPFHCPEQTEKMTALGAKLLPFCSVGGVGLNPPFVSYHFQHPWTLGLPFALGLLLVYERAPRSWAKWASISLLLGTLAIVQFVLFVTLAAALPVATAFRSFRGDRREIVRSFVAVLAAAAVASQSGGFFAHGGAAGMGLELHLGLTTPAAKSFEWCARVFGLLLPLGLVGLLALRRNRVLYLLLIAGSLVVLNSVRYKLSWDIVKFATVASAALAVPTTALLARGLARKTVWTKLLALAAVAALVATGVVFQATLIAKPKGVPAMYLRTPPPIEPDDAAAVTWLRRNMPPRAVMYRRKDRSRPYVVWGGLPQLWNDSLFPATLDFAKARNRLIADQPADPAPWLAQGVRFFVLDEHDGSVERAARRWLAEGRAKERARFGSVVVVELLATS